MQIALQAGLHQTDNDLLQKSLLRNRKGLRNEGVSIPRPNTYRRLLSEMINSFEDQSSSPEAREIFFDYILDDEPSEISRLVLTQENLFCVPKITFKGGIAYGKAEKKLKALQQIFSSDSFELFLSLRNPVTFLPALLDATPHHNLTELMNGLEPVAVRWPHLIDRITSALPDTPLTVWCYEDGPLIWGSVLREIAAVQSGYPVIGEYSRVSKIMCDEGAKKFQDYLAEHPNATKAQLRDTMIELLETHADPTKVECELDVPGWDQAFIEDLTWQYEEDVLHIGNMPNVMLIAI